MPLATSLIRPTKSMGAMLCFRVVLLGSCSCLASMSDTSFVHHSSRTPVTNGLRRMMAVSSQQSVAMTLIPARRYNSRPCSQSMRLFALPILDDVDEVAVDAQQSTLEAATNTNDKSDTGELKSLFSDIPLTAVALLNIVAIIWGTQHAVTKTVLDDCDPSSFSFARFGLAAGLVLPYIPSLGPVFDKLRMAMGGEASGDGRGSDSGDADLIAWRWGLEMGLWMFLGYAFQAVGLLNTTAQRSGFLLYLNVKFVPFFAKILFGRDISIPTWSSAFIALAGTALLSFDGTSAALNVGDAWSIAAAAASAMFILRLESASAAVPDSSALNAACLSVVMVGSLVWTISETYTSSAIPDMNFIDACRITLSNVAYTVQKHPYALIYLGGVTTALANYIQTKAQKDISAERASIIYAMDPVYGAIFANVLLGESLTSYGMVGAGIITVAAATNAFLDLGAKSTGESNSERNETPS